MFLGQKTINSYLHVCGEIYLRLTKLGAKATLDIHVRQTEDKGQYTGILEVKNEDIINEVSLSEGEGSRMSGNTKSRSGWPNGSKHW